MKNEEKQGTQSEDPGIGGSEGRGPGDRKEGEDKSEVTIEVEGKKHSLPIGTVITVALIGKLANVEQPFTVFLSTGKDSDPKAFTGELELQEGMFLTFTIQKTTAS